MHPHRVARLQGAILAATLLATLLSALGAVEQTAQAFLGVTMKCACCHDHNYDPIPQADYYRLRAVFEPMQKRLDSLPGSSNPRQTDLARIYDGDLVTKTAPYVKGNPQQKDKNQDFAPHPPTLLKVGIFSSVELRIPTSVAHPGRLAFVRETKLIEASSYLKTARESFDKLLGKGAAANSSALSCTNLSEIHLAVAERRSAEAKLAVAEMELLVVGQSIAADSARAFNKPDVEALCGSAAEFQRALKHGQSELAVAEAGREHARSAADEDRHYVSDLHATILHQLRLEPSRLDVPARKRLDKDHGEPIKEILAGTVRS